MKFNTHIPLIEKMPPYQQENTDTFEASVHKYFSNDKLFNCRLDIWISLLLVCCIMAVYWQVRTFQYISYDSPEYVFANSHVQSGLTFENIKWALTTTNFSNWHPLTWMSHMLDVQIFGLNPGQHKIINVFFHIINTLLLFYILKTTTRERLPSLLVAGLFALHPLHIQSVVWIAERKDLLSALFFFLSIIMYLRYLDLKSTPRYSLVLLMFALGLMAKPMIVTLPLILFLLDFWPLGRFTVAFPSFKQGPTISLSEGETFKIIILEKCPLFLLSILSGCITIYAQKTGGSVASLTQLPILERIDNALVSYIIYIYKVLWPVDLAIIYLHPGSQPLWLVIIACLILSGFSYLFLFHFRKYPFLAFGWLFFLITLIPVIGFIQVGVQALADRYMYLPIIGLFIIFSWSLMHLLRNYSHKPFAFFWCATGLLAITLGLLSWHQLQYWKNGEILFTRALSITQNNYVAENNLGYEFIQKSDFKNAENHFRQALRINPHYAIAHLNLGRLLIEDKKYEEGISQYLTALKINPGYADAHRYLGDTLDHIGRSHEAAYHYVQALRIDPNLIATYNNLGVILATEQKYDEAILMFKKALRLNPSFQGAKINLTKAMALKDQHRQ